MRCRLCLEELTNNFISLYNDVGDIIQDVLVESILKYLDLELFSKDDFSTQICESCWKHLDDFDKFCLKIKEKQETLKQELDNGNIKVPETCSNHFVKSCLDMFAGELECNDMDLMENLNLTNEEKIENFSFKNVSKPNEPEVPKNMKLRSKKRIKKTIWKTRKELKISPQLQTKKDMEAEEALIREHMSMICDICKEPLETFTKLKYHFNKEHNTMGYIECCNTRFKDRYLLIDHIKLHNDPNYFKCQLCDKVLRCRSSLNNHMNVMHVQNDQLHFECAFCSQKFKKQYLLDSHVKNRHGENLQCETCKKIFKNKIILQAHITSVHSNNLKIVCDLCGLLLTGKRSLSYHMSAIHKKGELHKKVQCSDCGNWFANQRSLKKHMEKHKEGNIFTCPVCGEEKSTKVKLTVHMKYYHNDKKFKCTFCEKELKTEMALKEHIATHTGQDLYTCSFCPKTFKSHSNMYSHRKKVHSDELAAKKLENNGLV